MCAQQRRRDRHGEYILRDMLDRIRVLGCERNRRDEPVVVFVNVLVEESPVQCNMQSVISGPRNDYSGGNRIPEPFV